MLVVILCLVEKERRDTDERNETEESQLHVQAEEWCQEANASVCRIQPRASRLSFGGAQPFE
jgi:hypothetical protein